MRKKNREIEATLFQKIKNKIGWALYSVRASLAARLPKRKREASLTKKRLKQGIFVYAVLFLPIVQFCIFYIGVNINSIMMAFQRYGDSGYIWVDAGDVWYNFKLVWNNFINMPVFGIVVRNSLLAFFIIQLMTPVVLFFTFYIYKKYSGYRFFKIVIFLPTIISTVIMITVYKQFCEVAIPYVLNKLFHVSVQGLLSNPETRFWAVMFYYMWLSFGTLMLMYLGSMNGISESIVEAAKLDGAGSMQEFFLITFPMIYPTFSTFFYTNIATIFTNQINLYSLWGGSADSSVWTFGYYLYKEIAQASEANYPYLATIGILMTFVTAPLTFFFKWLLTKIGPTTE